MYRCCNENGSQLLLNALHQDDPNVSQVLCEIGMKNEHIKATGQQQLPTLRRQMASRHSEAALRTATALPLPF